MIIDYHIHTKASADATGEMEEYIKKAEEKKIDEIGFSDHILLHSIRGYPRMSVKSMPAYVKHFLGLKRQTKLPIRLGAEIDFVADDIDKAREFIQKYPFDYVVGSAHFIGEWLIDHPAQAFEYSKRDVVQVYEEYFSLVRKLCESRVFDILAHPDLIKVFGHRPKTDFSDILTETAEAMARSRICAEINTKGLRRPCNELYPSEQFLKILHAHGIPVSFGSDAHEPNDVGRDFKAAIKLAKRVGYAHICKFDRRKRTLVEI